jgi:hypothetical protein
MPANTKQKELEIRPGDRFILVRLPDGVDFWEIFTAAGRLVRTPDFQEKPDIWLFKDGSVDLTLSDLYKLHDFLDTYLPDNARGKKTAIVVETGFQKSLAETFIQIAGDRLRRIRVFSDFSSAEKWVLAPG